MIELQVNKQTPMLGVQGVFSLGFSQKHYTHTHTHAQQKQNTVLLVWADVLYPQSTATVKFAL